MEGRAIVTGFIYQLLETFYHLWSDVWIKFDDNVAIIRRLDYRNFSVRNRLNTFLHVGCCRVIRLRRVEVFHSCLLVGTTSQSKQGYQSEDNQGINPTRGNY